MRGELRSAVQLQRWAWMAGGFLVIFSGVLLAAERGWEVRGEFVAVKPGDPAVVVLKLADARLVELPLGCFTPAQQTEIAALARANTAGGDKAAEAPGGAADRDQSATALLSDFERAAESCRSAVAATDVYRLLLATPGLPADSREAATQKLESWAERAARDEVRLGKEWVTPQRAAAARREAEGHLRQAFQMLRIGNPQVADDEFRKASRSDPASGTADFLLGLAAVLGQRPSPEKAGKYFREAVDREPDHGPALNNLALCEMQSRRFSAAVEAFRAAADHVAEPRVVVANVGRVIGLAADRRNRITPKQLEEFTALYRELVDDRGLQPADVAGGLVYLSLAGLPIGAGISGGQQELVSPADGGMVRSVPGYVVAEGMVVVPAAMIEGEGRLGVTGDPDGLQEIPAKVVASRHGVSLVRCDGLDVAPIPLAAASAPAGAPLLVMQPPRAESPSPATRLVAATAVTSAAGQASDPRFVYSAAAGRQPPGGLISDSSGRLVGLAQSTPLTPGVAASLNVAAAVEALWPLLKEAAATGLADEGSGPVGREAVAERLAAGTVRVTLRTAEQPGGLP